MAVISTMTTPAGIIQVSSNEDPNYPGYWISINGETLVLVEHDSSEGEHVIRVWNHGEEDEECTYRQVVPQKEEEEE